MEETLSISNIPYEINNVFRRIEETNKKIINCRSSLLFNNTCFKKLKTKYNFSTFSDKRKSK